MLNKGKAFENIVRQDWKKSFPGTLVFRLKDQMNGFKETSQNPSDWIMFNGKHLFFIECKSHKGSSIPFAAMPQYERLLAYKNLKNVCAGFVIWFLEKDLVIYVPIQTAEQIVKDGEKSIGLRMLDKYDIVKIPSVKKRVFMESNYRILEEWADKHCNNI